MAKALMVVMIGIVIGTLVAISTECTFPLVIVIGGILLGAIIIRLSEPDNFNFLFSLFLAAFLLRIILSIGLYLYALPFRPNSGFLIGDGFGYHMGGWWLSTMWHRGLYPDMETLKRLSASATGSTYDYYIGGVYYLIGTSPFSLLFINCLLGSITVIFVYLISKKIFSERVARIASLLTCFWPSFILWSTQNIKEPVIIFSVCLAVLSILNLRDNFSPWYTLVFFSSLLLLFIFGQVYNIVLIFSFLLYYGLVVMRSIKEKWMFVVCVLILGIAALYILKSVNIYTNKSWLTLTLDCIRQGNIQTLLEQLTFSRSGRAYGGTAFFANWTFTNPFKVFVFIPIGLFAVFFAPFPWQVGSLLQIIAIPEMLVWYFLLPFTIRGLVYSFKNKYIQVIPILLFISFMAILLGIVEGNIGTIFRHRAVILNLLLIFTSVGITLGKKNFNFANKGKIR